MSNDVNEQWARTIERCRERLGPPVAVDTSWFGRRPTERRHYASDCRFDRGSSKQKVVLAEGRVVWGHPVKANARLFFEGAADAPGVVVYATDRSADEGVGTLARVAEALSDLRHQRPRDPELIRLRDIMCDDFRAELPPISLPWEITGGRTIVMADAQFQRRRLPIGRVIKAPLPLVIHPVKTETNMILPLRYWADELVDAWRIAGSREAPPGTTDFVRLSLAVE